VVIEIERRTQLDGSTTSPALPSLCPHERLGCLACRLIAGAVLEGLTCPAFRSGVVGTALCSCACRPAT
jgi:hypothetical protein